jgi:hypothetical protein
MEDAKSALSKYVRNKDRPSLEALWTRHAPRVGSGKYYSQRHPRAF